MPVSKPHRSPTALTRLISERRQKKIKKLKRQERMTKLRALAYIIAGRQERMTK